MAASSHRKLSRKALKQPDEFVTILDLIGDLVADHLGRVIAGAVGLIVVATAILALSFYLQNRQRTASSDFYNAIGALSNKDYKAAEQGFSALAQDRSRHALGHLAGFYLAATYLAQNQTSKARDALQSYLAGGGNPRFRQMALVQLGVADEDLRDYQGARNAYLQAAQLNGPEKARAQIGAARALGLTGDRQGAIAAYQQFLRDNPFAQQRGEVIEALAQMGAPPQPAVQALGSAATKTTPGATSAPVH